MATVTRDMITNHVDSAAASAEHACYRPFSILRGDIDMYTFRLLTDQAPGSLGVLVAVLVGAFGPTQPLPAQDTVSAEQVRISIAVVENHEFDDADVVLVMDPDDMPGTTALLSIEREALTVPNLQRGIESLGRVLARGPERASDGPWVLQVTPLDQERAGRRSTLPAGLAGRVASWQEALASQVERLEQRRAARGLQRTPPPPPLEFLGADQVVGLMHATIRRDAWGR